MTTTDPKPPRVKRGDGVKAARSRKIRALEAMDTLTTLYTAASPLNRSALRAIVEGHGAPIFLLVAKAAQDLDEERAQTTLRVFSTLDKTQ